MLKRIIFIALIILPPFQAPAFFLEKINDIPVANDFVLSPAKVEFDARPGEVISKTITITNRSGEKALFWVDFEDLVLDDVQVSAEKNKMRSLAPHMSSDGEEFSLAHGERATVLVNVKIPAEAPRGGVYGIAMVSSKKISESNNAAGANIVTRLGSIFLGKIDGRSLEESGEYLSFDRSVGGFRIIFKNNGESHLNPYGVVEVKNIFGRSVEKVGIDPWFVLPNSTRVRDISWNENSSFYFYRISALLYPGYGGMEKIQSYNVWVYSDSTAALFVIILLVLLVGSLYFLKRYNKKNV